MSITVKEIQELRDKTGAGMMDCKEALTNSNGDQEKEVIRLHSYEVPEIIAIPIIEGSKKYLSWIDKSTV